MKTPASLILFAALLGIAACASGRKYQDAKMDFGAVRTVAVMPFTNLTNISPAGERVRDVFSTMLLSTGAVYVLPSGEVSRAVSRNAILAPATPSKEEVIALGKLLSADAVITGVLKEYGEVRSGSSTSNVISVSVEMTETQTGKVVWAAASTRGGVSFWDRLFGGGGDPMNPITEDAVRDLLNKLFH